MSIRNSSLVSDYMTKPVVGRLIKKFGNEIVDLKPKNFSPLVYI